jgi:hypothetical protein
VPGSKGMLLKAIFRIGSNDPNFVDPIFCRGWGDCLTKCRAKAIKLKSKRISCQDLIQKKGECGDVSTDMWVQLHPHHHFGTDGLRGYLDFFLLTSTDLSVNMAKTTNGSLNLVIFR